MNEIYFNEIPAMRYGLQLTRCVISPPERKTKFLDIIGADGSMDLMQGLGPARYKRRTVEAVFSYNGDPKIIVNRVINLLHEREMNIVLPGRSAYYMVGIVHINGSNTNSSGGITMEIDCMPWLLRRELTAVELPASVDPQSCVLYNQGLREVIPEVLSPGRVHLESNDLSIDLEPGRHLLPDLLIDGYSQRTVSVRGAGCMIQYREAVLL